MKLLKAWFTGLLLGGSLIVGVACGGKASVDGGDSNTHWLKECGTSADCGGLACICGVCTEPCDKDSNCATFGGTAVCEVPSGCASTGSTACVAKSSVGGSGAGGSGGSNTGAAGSSGMGGSAAEPACRPMAAASGGERCAAILGYAWDGAHCQQIQCTCEGADCDALFPSADECDHAYRACYAAQGLRRDCSKHADCVVASRFCCESCTRVDDPGQALMAVAGASPSTLETGVCIGEPQAGCDDCLPFEYSLVYAACIDQECRLLDLTKHARCETASDCRLTTRDCCACGGDFTESGVVAVDASFGVPDYCPAEPTCSECVGGSAEDIAQPICEAGVCGVDFLPI